MPYPGNRAGRFSNNFVDLRNTKKGFYLFPGYGYGLGGGGAGKDGHTGGQEGAGRGKGDSQGSNGSSGGLREMRLLFVFFKRREPALF